MPKSINLESMLPENLLRIDPKTQEFVKVPAKELKGKTVLIYFIAHWYVEPSTYSSSG